jgi:hypothetical protein
LRVFSLLWVIAGHTCMFSFPVSGEFRRWFNSDACSDIISLYTKIIALFWLTSGGSHWFTPQFSWATCWDRRNSRASSI